MELSDVTQHERRVRALLSLDDLHLIIARHVAHETGLALTDPRVSVKLIQLRTVSPQGPRAEVVIVADQSSGPVPESALRVQSEVDALKDVEK